MLASPIRSASPAPRRAFYAKPYVQVLAAGVVAWITRRLILSGGFQSPDPDFDDAAQVQ
ncbi:hypothetical protein SAMN02927914_06797, partial [Mesorhizobium qingshengii]